MGGSVKRVASIEEVLRWAFDELGKRAPTSLSILRGGSVDVPPSFYGAASRGPRASGSMFSSLVAGESGGTRAPIGLPHPDAIRVDEAIAALTLDASALAAEQIDAGMEELTDADALSRVLARASASAASAVRIHAKMGTRPEVRLTLPQVRQVRHTNGKPLIVHLVLGEYDERGRWQPCEGGTVAQEVPASADKLKRYPPGSYQKTEHDNPAPFLLGRAEYAAWRLAIDRLAETLDLETILVTPTTAPRRPWLGDIETKRPLYAVEGPPPAAAKPKVYPTARPRQRPSQVRHIKPSAA